MKRNQHLKNYYEMKLREHREEIDELKTQITKLSNMLWEMQKELQLKVIMQVL